MAVFPNLGQSFFASDLFAFCHFPFQLLTTFLQAVQTEAPDGRGLQNGGTWELGSQNLNWLAEFV